MEQAILRLISGSARLNVFQVTPSIDTFGMDGWVASKKYSFGAAGAIFVLNPNILDEVDQVFAREIYRFSDNCFESFDALRMGLKRNESAAWCAVKLYYSAFYAVHAILRMYGRSCSWLSEGGVRELKSYYSALNNSNCSVAPGLKRIYFSGSRLTIEKLSNSHADPWRELNKLLSEIESSVNASSAQNKLKTDVVATITTISDLISKTPQGRTDFSWISKTRNKIHYQSGERLWLPSERHSSQTRKHMADCIDAVMRQGVMRVCSNSSVERFSRACLSVIGFLIDILKYNIRRFTDSDFLLSGLGENRYLF